MASECRPSRMSPEPDEREAEGELDGGAIRGGFQTFTKRRLRLFVPLLASVEVGEVHVGRGERAIDVEGFA